MDRAALEALLERLRRAIADMDNELSELRRGLGRNLTRADVLAMIAEALSANGRDLPETAVGTVRCIACGRENRQMAGALAEADAIRRYGNPTNTLAIHQVAGGNRVAELYSSPDQLQGIESPRSARPFRAAVKISKQSMPSPPK
jgi:hypothetical protein